MYTVVNTKFDHPDTLTTLLNAMALKGWQPLFPIWHGEAIVFYQPESWQPFPFVHGSAEAEAEASNEEIEQLREP